MRSSLRRAATALRPYAARTLRHRRYGKSRPLTTAAPNKPLKSEPPTAVHRADYKPTNYSMSHVELSFILDHETLVTATSTFEQRPGCPSTLTLQGDGSLMNLRSLAVDGFPISSDQYQLTNTELTLLVPDLPAKFDLTVVTSFKPAENSELAGLYYSSSSFCTQCEAEGFRRITYAYDRPDVLSTYRVRLEATRDSCPVLLSNGNRVDAGELANGRHFAVWEDPFPKPSYLFALVAGNLFHLESTFETASGRTVELGIFTEHQYSDQLEHAMDSLKRSMKWDEDKFGLECDLDMYNIVAVSDFNMGAMENKGLNVFNTSATLATAETATDAAFRRIEVSSHRTGILTHLTLNFKPNSITYICCALL